MSQLDDKAIEMMAKNMEYIRLGLNNNKGNENTARWLFYLIKSYMEDVDAHSRADACLLYTSPSPRDRTRSRMPSSA